MSDVPESPNGAPPPPYTQPSPPSASGYSAEERQWAMFAHLSALAGFVIPAGNIIAPLVIWLLKKDTMPFVADQGRESLNFQITVLIAVVAAAFLVVVLIGFLLLPLIALAALVLVIIASIKANEGVAYRYPFTLRLIK
ncbi:MAG: DUF4870 domain-containing protein [Pseudomonadota bacterium]